MHEAQAEAELDLAVMLGRVTEQEAALQRGRARGMALYQSQIDQNTASIQRLVEENGKLAGEGGTFFEAKSAQGIVGLMRRGSFEDGRLTVRSGGVGFALGPDGAGVE